jgi:amino acid adenylation domain-containing protein
MSNFLHSIFEEQAKSYPDNISLKFDQKEITYSTLNELSNQLANYLIFNGAKEGDIIKMFMDRSIDMIISILGILKCGAAYLPIDTKLPEERLDFLLHDTYSPICLSTSKNSNKIATVAPDQKIVCIDSDWTSILTYSKEAPEINIQDSNIAVVLYTSGSTGFPKGVLLSHRSLANRIIWDREFYNHTSDDIILQHASYTFDFSVLEIFMALANGGKLILARAEFEYESFYLIDLIQQEQITKMGSGPSLIKAYIKFSDFEKCSTLKQVFLGGEILDAGLQNDFFRKSSAELINIYGPTETSISVLNWTCKRNSKDNIVPIGFPVANMQIYLLDENMEKVPDGEIGEIFISGVGVGSGYHNRPDLTAKVFLPDPFASDESSTMYKSGDLGKKLANGAIQFCGRKDFQIKIRGLRVELQEIEYHLSSHYSINNCVVSGINYNGNETKLIAYMVAEPNQKVKIDEIKTYLLSKLPDYMVPSLFIQLDKFPLSPNGKIDRKSLPYPDKIRLLAEASFIPPETETQRNLIRIWEKSLKLSPIGIGDSFTSLGGDSLSKLEIHFLMKTEMGCNLPLSSFAKANTIKEQATIIDNDFELNQSGDIVVLRKSGDKTPVIYVQHVQSEGIDTAISLQKWLGSDHPLIATLPFGNDPTKVPDSVEKCALRYVQSIENQFESNEYAIGGFSIGGIIALEMAAILQKKGKTIKFIFLLDTFHPALIKDYISHRRIHNRILFYSKKVVLGNFQAKKNISQYLVWRANDIFSKLFSKTKWTTLELVPDMQKKKEQNEESVKANNTNLSLALRFTQKPYQGNVIIIAAESSPHVEIQNNASIKLWKETITGELIVYRIPATHFTIMHDNNIKIHANILNEHLQTY